MSPKYHAFTLVELLVVVLILAILMGQALPLYLSALANAQTHTIRVNMRTIATAEQAYRLQNPAHQYLIGDASVIFHPITGLKDLGAGIAGPGDRTYSVLGPGDSCDPNPVPKRRTSRGPIPSGSFAVQSSHDEDGCYLPGVSTE